MTKINLNIQLAVIVESEKKQTAMTVHIYDFTSQSYKKNNANFIHFFSWLSDINSSFFQIMYIICR